MNVVIQIHYKATELGNKLLQRGSFPARGRKPEKVAYDWWRDIKKEMPVDIELEKVIIDGEDQTEKIKKIEKGGDFNE